MNVRPLLKQLNVHPSKGKGQNFLIDESVLEKLLAAAELKADDSVLEIGPGLGLLTLALVERVASLTAVEVDPNLASHVRRLLETRPNSRLIEGDILAVDRRLLPSPPFKVVANIPYAITSPLLRRFLEPPDRPSRLVLMVQREVAERVTAQPGHTSLLTVSVQYYASARIAAIVPASVFFPVPEVESAILVLDTHERPPVPAAPVPLFRVVTAGFSQRRKQLRNSLSGGLRISPAETEAYLAAAGIDPRRRAETLSLNEWSRLTEVIG